MRLLPTSHGGGWHKPGGRHLKVVACGTANMRAVLKAQINKTDRNDARGMAQMMRAGLYRLGAWEDATQSETANAVDPTQTAADQGHRHR